MRQKRRALPREYEVGQRSRNDNNSREMIDKFREMIDNSAELIDKPWEMTDIRREMTDNFMPA